MKVRTIGVNTFFWVWRCLYKSCRRPPPATSNPPRAKERQKAFATCCRPHSPVLSFEGVYANYCHPAPARAGGVRSNRFGTKTAGKPSKPNEFQGACWARQTCFRELTYGHIWSIMVQSRCSLYFFHRCARHPPADKPARRPIARIDEKNENRCSPLAIYTQYISKNGHQNKKYGQNVATYTDYIWP